MKQTGSEESEKIYSQKIHVSKYHDNQTDLANCLQLYGQV